MTDYITKSYCLTQDLIDEIDFIKGELAASSDSAALRFCIKQTAKHFRKQENKRIGR